MKTFITFSIALLYSFAFLNAQNYMLILDKDTINIQLDESTNYVTKDNCQIDIQLLKKPIQTYGDQFVTFNYSNKYSLTKTDLGDGVEQLMIMTANGNGIIIQEYSRIDPTFISDFMMNELTKESIKYGYKGSPIDTQVSLTSGIVLDGRKSVLTYNYEVEEYQVFTYGSKDKGIMIATLKNNLNETEGDEVMDLFFDTLDIKMK